MKKSVCCVNPSCSYYQKVNGDRSWLKPHGAYRRKCDNRLIPRFRCGGCKKTCSYQTFNLTYRQRNPRINKLVRSLICSKVSMRQISKEFGINRKTVRRRFLFLAEKARINQKRRLACLKNIDFIQMDEMETHEHTKCKPLSIALAVVPGSRHILGAKASEMPAKGPLAEISRKKYGLRRDDREEAFQDLLKSIKPNLNADVWVFSDKKSTYPRWIREVLPDSSHFKAKGKRGCVAGYGEMKKTGFDPLFWLNHAAAMIRDALARMLRQTWCNTKQRIFLQQALDIHIDYHNENMDHLGKPVFNRKVWLNRCLANGVLLQ